LSFTPENRRRPLDAVVVLAAQDSLGEELFWETVEPALMELVANPMADRDLRVLLPKINDADVIATLEEWFTRAARERGRDTRRALTNAEELITPLIGLGVVLAAGGMASGLTLKRKADAAEFDTEVLSRLAEICRKELENRK